MNAALKRAQQALVLVTVGSTWASGIIISNTGCTLLPHLSINLNSSYLNQMYSLMHMLFGLTLKMVSPLLPLFSSSSLKSNFFEL